MALLVSTFENGARLDGYTYHWPICQKIRLLLSMPLSAWSACRSSKPMVANAPAAVPTVGVAVGRKVAVAVGGGVAVGLAVDVGNAVAVPVGLAVGDAVAVGVGVTGGGGGGVQGGYGGEGG